MMWVLVLGWLPVLAAYVYGVAVGRRAAVAAYDQGRADAIKALSSW